MNILFVTQYFYPENFRINDLALTLVSQGHSVSVLTGMPNYPTGKLFKGYSSIGPFYEEWNGVKIYRVNNRPRKTGSKNLALNYLSFVIKGCKGAKALCNNNKYDVIYAFGTSPITQAFPALTIRKINHTPVILNVQDLWPDNVRVITGIDNPLIIKLLDLMVDYIYNRCDIILGTSRSFVEAIVNRKGLKVKHKVKYWPQYSTVSKADVIDNSMYKRNAFNIAFTGNIGQGQGLDLVIKAFKYLKDKDIVLNLFGDGRAREELEKYVNDKGLSESVLFHGSFSEDRIPAILNGADVALLCLNDSPIFEKTIPAKLQTYLSCGCPILGVVSGESAKIIEDNEVGICIDNKNVTPREIAESILELSMIADEDKFSMSMNAIMVSEEEFNKKKLVKKLVKMMEVLSS